MSESFLEQMQKTSHLAGGNVAYIESLYETYLENPNNVPPEWRTYFEKLPRVDGVIASDVPHSTVIRHFELIGRNRLRARPQSVATDVANDHERKQMRVTELIAAYRHRGHKRATIDPLGMMERPPTPVLDLAYHHLSAADLDTVFQTGSFFYGAEKATLARHRRGARTHLLRQRRRRIHAHRRCGRTAVGAATAGKRAVPSGVRRRREADDPRAPDRRGRARALPAKQISRHETVRPRRRRESDPDAARSDPARAVRTASSKRSLRWRIAGASTYSSTSSANTRASCSTNSKANCRSNQASGDVKYHQGFSSNVMTPGGEMHLALAFNPSHLEIVGPVAEGSVRARQDRRLDYTGNLVVPV